MQIIFTDGLGNQMFQYALYLSMKAKGRHPQINTGIAFRSTVHNGFELCDVFQLEKESLPIVMNSHFLGGVTIFFTRYVKATTYTEVVGFYDNGIFRTHKPFIYGYWQNIRYFKDVQDEIRMSFKFRNIDDRNIILGNEMKNCNSVSLHIRRGDYLKYPEYQICTPSYYKKAIDYINQNVDSPFFYIFSDDLEWSENMMKEMGGNYKIIDYNRGRDNYKDLYLMTCCHHNILANSSFSWWGAWLGNQEGKVVVCPKIWKKGSNLNPQIDSWVKIEP